MANHRTRFHTRFAARCGGARIVLAMLGLSCLGAGAAEPEVRRLYQVTTEIGMPHLEENLRYANTQQQLCLGVADLPTAFPILRHEALAGCDLVPDSRQQDAYTFVLSCRGGHGTTGTAHWRFEDGRVQGTLDVRLGGKNMTFYQRISGRALGPCPSVAAAPRDLPDVR